MTQLEPKAEWLHRAAQLEDNRIISVGGLAVRLAAKERLAERLALAKLVELRRRELGLSVEEVAAQAGISVEEIVSLERGLIGSATGTVLRALAGPLKLPADKVFDLVRPKGETDTSLRDAALRFTVQASPAAKLSPSEQAALSQFLKVLTLV